jgi:hypothetical protein
MLSSKRLQEFNDMPNANALDSLVRRFAQAVIDQENATSRFDIEGANMHARRVSAVFDELCKHGDPGRETLTKLFKHESGQVRVTTAAFLLRYAHDRARAVLAAEAKGDGLLALAAGQAIQRWEDGTWELDPG